MDEINKMGLKTIVTVPQQRQVALLTCKYKVEDDEPQCCSAQRRGCRHHSTHLLLAHVLTMPRCSYSRYWIPWQSHKLKTCPNFNPMVLTLPALNTVSLTYMKMLMGSQCCSAQVLHCSDRALNLISWFIPYLCSMYGMFMNY